MILYPTPILRNPLTDVFPVMTNIQKHPLCAQRELQVVECMDAYGVYRGQEKCRLLVEDMYECVFNRKKEIRSAHIKWEQRQKIRLGEKDAKSLPKPPLDLY